MPFTSVHQTESSVEAVSDSEREAQHAPTAICPIKTEDGDERSAKYI